MRYKSILLFGAPGSGKGTQGKILGAIPGFYHSACGDVFRSLDLQSEMGRVFWEYAGKGKLVPDEFTVKLWKQYIQGMEMVNQFHPETQLLVLDGIPRNVEQAKLLDDTIEVVKVIHLVCADMNKMVERLRRRALKENRFDDANDKVIQHRLEVYEQETAPVLSHYPKQTIQKIDATMSQIRVLSEIIRVLVPLKEEMDRAWEKSEAAAVAKNPPTKAALVTATVATAGDD
ncbi:MAG TPA: nucleoside monophosphate kinase [Tepidisphaeraceae bacterium]|nr:nucleoside monophosphate kinase [Tepidisphaeraceae bacterium]